MNYATFNEVLRIYPTITEEEYNNFAWETNNEMNIYTSGVDGVKKLKIAYPTDEDDKEAVKRCFSEILYTLVKINKERNNVEAEASTVLLNGRIVPATVASMSSGSESISFATKTERGQYYNASINNEEKNKLIYSTIKKYLSNVKDANGVNLLYGGIYPCIVTR